MQTRRYCQPSLRPVALPDAEEAGPGELLISIDAVQAAELDAAGLDHRTVAVRGRSDPIEVVADRPLPGARVSSDLS
jgi:hypothetical protein